LPAAARRVFRTGGGGAPIVDGGGSIMSYTLTYEMNHSNQNTSK